MPGKGVGGEMNNQGIDSYDWSVAIFSSREDAATLWATIQAAISASDTRKTVVDVLINGNPVLCKDVEAAVRSLPRRRRADLHLRVWHIVLADKAHAWNVFVHRIWTGSRLAFFIDGYAQVMPDSLTLISEGLSGKEALGATGVPSHGRSARTARATMIRKGGIQGNFHAIRGDVLDKLRDQGFVIPLGFYYVDALYGAVLNFGLDPANNTWDARRILVVPAATWFVRTASLWSVKGVTGHWRRLIRQASGALQNAAVREHMTIQRKAPVDLPRTATSLVLSWIAAHPQRMARLIIRNPLCLLAVFRARKRRDWSSKDTPPELVTSIRWTE